METGADKAHASDAYGRTHHYLAPLAREGRVCGVVEAGLPHARRLRRVSGAGGHQAIKADGPEDPEDNKHADHENHDRNDGGDNPRAGGRG